MAFSLNRIMLIGNLGQDAENRFTTNNVSVTTFSLATTRSYKGKDGNWVNEATWHNIVSYNLPDFYKEQLKKGKKFYVEGRLSKRDYTDKDGIKRYITEVISEQLIPLEGREGGSTGSSNYSEKATTYNDPEPAASTDDDLPF
ncbi:MAG: Single-stranded DNA-binding protein [Ignavibacteria bacterium]|nr:MAG: Single-stranded DNA-binding protein [Ignavibacteria bacterium]KAF0162113.1 MAG: Single-stranded DNA-binding protein [Ignavibacteria bacterium]